MTKERTKGRPGEKTPRQEMLLRYEAACIEAGKKREIHRDLRQKYREDSKLRAKMRERLIEDLVRVLNHPDNPYAGWAASRKRYRELGWYPEILVMDLFGTHAEFERAADLRDKRGTSKVKLTTARLHTEKEIREYAEECVMRHVGKWTKEYHDRKGVKTVIVFGDSHGQFVDPFAMRVLLDVVKMVQPDGIVANGDVGDFPTVGRFTQMPGAGNLSLQDEFDFQRERILRPIRKAAPKAWFTYHIGNHEHRVVRYLADTAPELADLRCLRWDRLLDIDDMKIEIVFGGNWMAPRQRDRKENVARRTWKVYYDCFVVTHGNFIAQNAPWQHLGRYGMSGCSGDTHRPSIVTAPTLACPFRSWTTTPMMAGFAVGKDYVDTPSNWTMGFGVFVVDPSNGIVAPHLVLVNEDFATYCGHVWRPTAKERETRLAMWGEGGDVTSHKRRD